MPVNCSNLMNYKIVNLISPRKIRASILIIYTGGTFGMASDERGALRPFNFGRVIEHLPELKSLDLRLTVISFPDPIDSSNMGIKEWQDLVYIIEENYNQYDGFVILHGTDTMAYTSSALSFMVQHLSKPIVLTGAQIPIGGTRSDARENLVTALEIASTFDNKGRPLIPEVCIYFNHVLLRGNRAQKVHSSNFSAFKSENYPILAEAGINIEFNRKYIRPNLMEQQLKVYSNMNPEVGLLKLFPAMSRSHVEYILGNENMQAIVIETFGSGNTMTDNWFLDALSSARDRGLIMVNVSQCLGGTVTQGKYETSSALLELGVVGGADLTVEAALTKLMHLLGNENEMRKVREKLVIPLCGEMDVQVYPLKFQNLDIA